MSEFTTLRKIFALFREININPGYLLIPVPLAFIAAAFEGMTAGLLIPLLSGFIQRDFSFIKEAPYISSVVNLLPNTVLLSDKYLFAALLSFLAVAVLLKNIFKYLSSLSMHFIALRALHHLRKVLFGRYVRFGKLYFDRSNVGHHATVLMQISQEALVPVLNIPKYMNSLLSLIVYLVVMSMISWKLTLIALPLFAILHFSVQIMLNKIRALSVQIVERGTALGKKSIEILSTIPLIKAYSTEDKERDRYSRISDQKAKLDFKVRVLREIILPLQEIITLFMGIVLFAMMAGLLVMEDVSASPFIVYFYLVLNASQKFGTLTSFRSALATARGPLDEVMKVFSDEGKHYVKSGGVLFTGFKDKIEFRNLTFAYQDGRNVLENISFCIKKGSMTSIVGPTGVGKSTIINLIMRYYDCPPGSIFIDGEDIRSFEIKTLLKHIALVSQDVFLFHSSLRDNISYGLSGVTEDDIRSAVTRARLDELIGKLPHGIDTLIGDRGVKLSGGEKQRVSIARALLKKAEILVLDEATSSLDSRTEKLIQEAIDEAIHGRTSIVIAHRLSTIRHADSIIVIEDGNVVEEGKLDELLRNNGSFHRLWEEQKFT